MGIVTLTRKNQVTLVKEVVDKLGLKLGDKMIESVEDGKVVLVKLDDSFVERAFGIWKSLPLTGLEFENKMRGEWKKREKF